MSVIDRSYAEEAAAAPAAAAAPPACAGNADPKLAVLEKCTPNSGDTAWMLTSVALVLLMTIPGLGLFYGGMVRKKNVRRHRDDELRHHLPRQHSLAGLHLQPGVPRGHTVHRRARPRVPARASSSTSPTASALPIRWRRPSRRPSTSCFQLTFAIITPALIAGAFAERMKFSAMLWFIGLWAIFVYAPVAHWVWGPDGFLSAGNADNWVKVLDFAGGTVVHINSGVAGLMACIVLGKRKETGPGHNMVLTFIGASLLWVGWFGFNAGSAVSAGLLAGMAMLVTHMAAAVAAFTWMIVEWLVRGKPTVIGICTGAVAGLVAITPASGFVGPIGSVAIGIAAGIVCYWGCTGLKHMLGYDDALDAFGVHAVGGIVGALLTGVFAVEMYGGQAGLLDGNPGQVLNQLYGVVIVFVYDAVVSLIILKLVDIFIGLRVPDEVEREGLDLALHGETVH